MFIVNCKIYCKFLNKKSNPELGLCNMTICIVIMINNGKVCHFSKNTVNIAVLYIKKTKKTNKKKTVNGSMTLLKTWVKHCSVNLQKRTKKLSTLFSPITLHNGKHASEYAHLSHPITSQYSHQKHTNIRPPTLLQVLLRYEMDI